MTGRIRRVLFALAILSQAGCVGDFIRMKPDELAAVRARKDIEAVVVKPAPFLLELTASRVAAAMGGVGGKIAANAAANSDGKDAVTRYGLTDPGAGVAAEFLKSADAKLSIQGVRMCGVTPADDSIGSLRAVAGQGLVFEFRTMAQSYRTLPTHPGLYHSVTKIRGRVVSLADGKVLWLSSWRYEGPGADAPTIDRAQADDGARMKAAMADAVHESATHLFAQFCGTERRQPDEGEVSAD